MNVPTFAVRIAGVVAAGAVMVATLVSSAAPAEAARRAYHPSMSMSATHIHTGDPVVIKGHVNLYRKSTHKVYLQYRYNENGTTKWKTLRTLKTSRYGNYSTTTRPSNSRDRDYRIKKYGSSVRTGSSAVIHLVVDPVVTTKTETVKFTVVEQPNPNLDMCTRNVLTQGVDGTTTYTYVDGKLDPAQTVTVPKVDEVDEVGTSTVPCVTDMKPRKSLEGSPVSVVITGRNLAGATGVTFDGRNGWITSATDTTVTAAGPLLPAGTAKVVLTVSGTDVTVGDFEVFPKPAVTAVEATSGSLTGGETVTVTGKTLGTTSKVTFTAKGTVDIPLDSMPAIAAKFRVVDDTTVTVTVPAGVGGKATVELSTDYGTASTSYTYKAVSRDGSELERQIFDEINKRRLAGATCGPTAVAPVPALTWNGAVSDLARSHVADIDARYQLYVDTYPTFTGWHGTPGLRAMAYRFALAGFNFDGASEILQRSGSSSTAVYVVDNWVSSPAHCNALMASDVTSAGVGAVQHSENDTLLSVVDFQ